MKNKDIKFLEIRYLRGPNIWTYRPVIEAVVDIGELEDFPSNTIPGFCERLTALLPSLVDHRCSYGERGDDLLTAVSIAVGKPRAWVDALDADQAILLAAKVLEVNADFFTRTVMPRLDGLIARTGATAAMATAGSTPSST